MDTLDTLDALDARAGFRIYVLNGAVLFFGDLPELPLHRHASAAICFGLNGAFQLRRPQGNWQDCSYAVIPPFAYHATRPGGGQGIAMLFLEAGSAFYRRLLQDKQWEFEPGDLGPLLQQLRAVGMSQDPTRVEELAELCGRQEFVQQPRDARIRRSLESIHGQLIEPPGVEDLAREVGLSGSRYMHLFQQELGLPLRRYRAWLRMKQVALGVAEGQDLTTAALAAGFFDSAHFSRAFRNMFGLPPTAVLRPDTQIMATGEVSAGAATWG